MRERERMMMMMMMGEEEEEEEACSSISLFVPAISSATPTILMEVVSEDPPLLNTVYLVV